ncbi:MAG: hypothetical protein GY798_22045 [Hyphomicrobiales bacterium]|nr:hypothetical protein [Hyphomicrobiales bacterium]
MAVTKPRLAVAYHFTNDPDTLPQMVDGIRETYDGPLSMAIDFVVWNVTKDEVRARLSAVPQSIFQPPPLVEKRITGGDEAYKTPAWIMEGIEPEVLPVIDKIYNDFNEARGTNIPNPLKWLHLATRDRTEAMHTSVRSWCGVRNWHLGDIADRQIDFGCWARRGDVDRIPRTLVPSSFSDGPIRPTF